MSLEIAMTLAEQIRNNGYTDSTFKFIGSGISRNAYLSRIDGMVYKYGHHSCNVDEMNAAARLNNLFHKPGVFIPSFIVYDETELYGRSVSETVYLPKHSELHWSDSRYRWFTRMLDEVGVTDTHSGNVYLYKDILVCIDLGYSTINQ
jgi:hypothetical protein